MVGKQIARENLWNISRNANIFEVKVEMSKTCLLENIRASISLGRHVQEFPQYSADVYRFLSSSNYG